MWKLQTGDGIVPGVVTSHTNLSEICEYVRDNCGLTELEYHEFLLEGSFERPGQRFITYWKDE